MSAASGFFIATCKSRARILRSYGLPAGGRATNVDIDMCFISSGCLLLTHKHSKIYGHAANTYDASASS